MVSSICKGRTRQQTHCSFLCNDTISDLSAAGCRVGVVCGVVGWGGGVGNKRRVEGTAEDGGGSERGGGHTRGC